MIYFFIGSCIASFINVVIERMPQHENYITGRSYCHYCGRNIQWYDLIPVLSYVFLKGKCRYCHHTIPLRELGIEIFGGLLFLVCYYYYGMNIAMIMIYLFFMVLLAISMIDLKTLEIPDTLIVWCLIISIMTLPFIKIDIGERLLGSLIISVPMMMINFFIEDCFGGGDIKLIAVCGFFMGWKRVFIGTYIAIMIAGIFAGYYIFKHSQKRYMAFAPFLSIGMVLSILYGQNLYHFLFMLISSG